MDYLSVKATAEQWSISDRRVRALCAGQRIPGAVRQGKTWLIPVDAVKPGDGRQLRGKSVPFPFREWFLRIDAKKARLDAMRPLTSGEIGRLREEFIVKFTYNSNAIEGSTLTLQETAMVLEGLTIAQKPLKEHLEAVGHRDAFQYIQQLVRDKVPLTEWMIKEIHSLVLMDRPEDKGVYRRIPVQIMGAVHEPVQPFLVQPKMEQLISDNRKKSGMHTLDRIAWFHLTFEGIHPFINGNGRTGRLLLNFDLMQHGYLPVDVKFTDRGRYYEAFDSFYRDGDSGPMVQLIAAYVEERLDRMLGILA